MKQIKINWNYLKYLFWLGPMLVIVGLTSGVVSDSWIPIPLGLIIAGIVIVGLWLIFASSSEQGFWGKRSTQVGTNALLATIAMLVILGLINLLGVRYATRIDLTENKLFTLSPQSQEVVKKLQQPIKVWLFERDANPSDRELLENYRRYSSQFNFEVVDPQKELGLAQKFGVQSPGEVYLEAGTRRQLLQMVKTEPLSEVKLTNTIEQITSDRTDKIYFLQGHGEHPNNAVRGGISQAISSLKTKSFTAEPLNLAQKLKVPKDAAVVVVAGAKRELFKEEVKALSDYITQGGSLLLMIDPSTKPGFDSLLKEWGVKLDNRLAVDASGKGPFGPAVPLVTNYGEHPITKDFGNGISFYPVARPIELTPIKGVEQVPLLFSDQKSWAESDLENKNLEFNEGRDRQGPLILGVALSRQFSSPTKSPSPAPSKSPETAKPTDQKPSESRLIVVGNSEFATDGIFDKQLNGDVFLNAVSWLSKRDSQVLSIRPKEQQNRRINMSVQQAKVVGWTSLLVVPLIGFSTAGFMWWRRR